MLNLLQTDVDYRLPEKRMDMVMAWADAMYQTGELDQQLRLMNHAVTDIESKLWLAFLWGCCYNLIGPWVIMSKFPTPPEDMEEFAEWYNANFERIRFDTDCRYRKSKMLACVQSYLDYLKGRPQAQALLHYLDDKDAYESLNGIANSWKYFGRLSVWNYLEALALVTEHPTFDCPDFLLTEVTDSESNRNGVAFLVNREDLLTKKGKLKTNGQTISQADCVMLNGMAEHIFQQIKSKFPQARRFNVETIFCWNKKRFRGTNSRYLGWDDERTVDEMNFIREHWPEVDLSGVEAARKHFLPEFMWPESGVEREKMGVFFTTGKPVDLFKYRDGVKWATINKPEELSLW